MRLVVVTTRKDPFASPITEVELFFQLYKKNTYLVRKLEEKLAALGLTLGRLCLLYALQRAGRPSLPSELGDDLAVTRANVSGLLNGLEKSGYVRREMDASDRRRILVHLTPEGEAALDQAWPLYEEAVRANLRTLTAEEQREMIRLLKKIED
jgi:MarR family 2-MHQ and catechol resistance regulon transcriptional repressor